MLNMILFWYYKVYKYFYSMLFIYIQFNKLFILALFWVWMAQTTSLSPENDPTGVWVFKKSLRLLGYLQG